MSAFLKNLPVKLPGGRCYLSLATDTPVLIHTGRGGGGRGTSVRLEGRNFARGVENTNMTDCFSSLKKPVLRIHDILV